MVGRVGRGDGMTRETIVARTKLEPTSSNDSVACSGSGSLLACYVGVVGTPVYT